MWFFKPKECGMKSKACGWIHTHERSKKLRKTKFYYMSYGTDKPIRNWLCHFTSNHWEWLWKLLFSKTEYQCEDHWLLSEFGLVKTDRDGLDCYARIEELIRHGEIDEWDDEDDNDKYEDEEEWDNPEWEDEEYDNEY